MAVMLSMRAIQHGSTLIKIEANIFWSKSNG
jgi:hypothetical protein